MLNNPALRRLVEGNLRYVSSKTSADISESRRVKTAYKQKPFAIVLGCSDSRVPPEIIFDQNLGDLFVVRTAAGIPDQSVIGTVEFGIWNFQCPLLVVLGHTRCGGVRLALEYALGKTDIEPGFQYIVDALQPPVEMALQHKEDSWNFAAKCQVQAVLRQLGKSPIVTKAVRNDLLRMVMGWYDIETGKAELSIVE
jgi:carbonic anhydrase